MLLFYVLLLTVVGHSIAKPIPESNNLSSNDGLVLAEETDTGDLISSNQPGCTPNTSTKDLSDEEALGSQNFDIFRRSVMCSPTSKLVPGQNQEPHVPIEPSRLPLGSPKPSKTTTDSGCTESRPWRLTCGGPEVRNPATDAVEIAMDCVHKDATQIEARRPWPLIPTVARYCCQNFGDEWPDFAGFDCIMLEPIRTMFQFTREEYDFFMEYAHTGFGLKH